MMGALVRLLLPVLLAVLLPRGGAAQGACRTAQITFDSSLSGETRSLEVQYSPQPYGRGILCVQHRVSPESLAPISWRVTMGAASCDPSHPSFNDTGFNGTLGQEGPEGPAEQAALPPSRRQVQDFPPVCGAHMAPGTDCQETVMWCSASLWQPFGVHLESQGVAPYCLIIRCGGEA
eukprot:COSAG03_NODE_644_length_6518_cov_2.496806_6_plen_177_part_00